MVARFLCVLGLAAVGGTVFAADEAAVTVRFRTLGWEYSPADLLFDSSGEPTAIEVPQSFRSPEYSYTGGRRLTFFRLVRGEGGELVRKPVCEVHLTEGVEEWLFLFVSSPNGESIRVFGLDDSVERFPYGSCRFFNLTDRTLGVVFGQERFRLEPKSADVMDPSVAGGESVQLQLLAIRNEELQDVYNTRWPQSERVRSLIFIKESERRRGRVDIKSIPEYAP